MAIATLPQKIKKELKALLVEAIAEALYDPDRGLELSRRAKVRLRRARIAPRETVALSEIKRKYY